MHAAAAERRAALRRGPAQSLPLCARRAVSATASGVSRRVGIATTRQFPPNAIASICAIEETTDRVSTAAARAMEAHVRSGHSVRAMPQTAWATIATATSLRRCRIPTPGRPLPLGRAVSEEHQKQGRRRRKACPRGQAAEIARAREADGERDLAARRARQELAQRHQIRRGGLIEPAAADHKFITKIADVRDRAAE